MRKYDLEAKKTEYRFRKRELVADICSWISETDLEMNGDVMKREVMPYGFKITIGKMMENILDYDSFTSMSQITLRQEVEGLIPIINGMIDWREQPETEVQMISGDNSGQVVKIKQEIANTLVECGFAKWLS